MSQHHMNKQRPSLDELTDRGLVSEDSADRASVPAPLPTMPSDSEGWKSVASGLKSENSQLVSQNFHLHQEVDNLRNQMDTLSALVREGRKANQERSKSSQNARQIEDKPESISKAAKAVVDGLHRIKTLGGPLATERIARLDGALAFFLTDLLLGHEERLAEAIDDVHAETAVILDQAIANVPRPPFPAEGGPIKF